MILLYYTTMILGYSLKMSLKFMKIVSSITHLNFW
jgi:hypothetical protein